MNVFEQILPKAYMIVSINNHNLEIVALLMRSYRQISIECHSNMH